MPSSPLVSIVTPSYNQAWKLLIAAQSRSASPSATIEYIIVDGGSTDGSPEIIQKYTDRLAWWVSEPDKGQTDAINKGFKRAKGDILAWLNSDDTYLPNALSEAVEFLQTHPQVGMVYGDANLVDENGHLLGKFPARQTDYRRLRRGYVHIPQQASFFRAELWREVGPLDPTFYFAMDYDLWVRIARISTLHYYPQTWANFRLHDSGKSVAEDDRCWPEMMRVHKRDGGSWFSWLVVKAKIRPLLFSWMPLSLRLWLRRNLI